MTVADRADANFVVHATWALERTAGAMTRVADDLVLADSGLACDTFNFVCRARLHEAGARAAAAAAVRHFAQVERPFSWWVGPADRPASLGATLGDLGLAPAEGELAMSLPLDALPADVGPVEGLEVRRVRSEAELRAFADLSAANWSPPDAHVLEFYRRTAPALLQAASPQWYYLGYLEGRPVATAEATVTDGTAGLYNISTRPEFRGRGIGSRMTWQPLHDARAAGCDLAVLQAAPDGVSIYRRLGFAAYGDITEYKPSHS